MPFFYKHGRLYCRSQIKKMKHSSNHTIVCNITFLLALGCFCLCFGIWNKKHPPKSDRCYCNEVITAPPPPEHFSPPSPPPLPPTLPPPPPSYDTLRRNFYRTLNIRERGRRGPWKEVGIVYNGSNNVVYALFRRAVDLPRNRYEYYCLDKHNGIRMDLDVETYLNDGNTVTITAKPGEGSFTVQLHNECPYDEMCESW